MILQYSRKLWKTKMSPPRKRRNEENPPLNGEEKRRLRICRSSERSKPRHGCKSLRVFAQPRYETSSDLTIEGKEIITASINYYYYYYYLPVCFWGFWWRNGYIFQFQFQFQSCFRMSIYTTAAAAEGGFIIVVKLENHRILRMQERGKTTHRKTPKTSLILKGLIQISKAPYCFLNLWPQQLLYSALSILHFVLD